MSRQKLTIRIDRIVVDQPGLTREAVAEALQTELRTALAAHGPTAFGSGRAVEALGGSVRPATRQTRDGGARSLASATVRTLTS